MQKKIGWPSASVIIASYNNAKVLRTVVEALLKLDYPAPYEIIVADDGSSDNTAEIMKSFSKEKKVTFIPLPHGGVCKARNAAIRAAKNDIVINIDHDCIASPQWLKQMAAGFQDKKAGVVSAYDYYGGSSTGFRKSLLEKVGGGYDEDYRYYREDTDLSFKIMDLGYEFKLIHADYEEYHKMIEVKGWGGLLKYALKRLKYHQNDVLLYKKHPTEVCRNFLHVKYGFLVDPAFDFSVATGTWKKDGKFELSSPRGITFLENKSPLHAIAIGLLGVSYVLAVKTSRLMASIKFGKLLI